MKLKAGIIGATGMVGQRFIELLRDHPFFEVSALMASERSAGKKYGEAASWYLTSPIPGDISEMEVQLIDTKAAEENGVDIIFSAIPSSIAREVEGSFAKNYPVFSNTATYRMEGDIPLLVPEVNPEHFSLIDFQRKNRGWGGFIATNPNCSTIGLVIPLKPLYDSLGIKSVNVVTMQALSGAGYSGVPSMAVLDNMLPYIGGEEGKLESEPAKILGELDGSNIEYAGFPIFASCNRVMVRDGHTESVFIELENDFSVDEVREVLSSFRGLPQELKLPSAPENPIVVFESEDRPQPFFDRNLGGGMSVSVGRIRKQDERKLKFTCLSHNTIRGAAGASILNAELALKKEII